MLTLMLTLFPKRHHMKVHVKEWEVVECCGVILTEIISVLTIFLSVTMYIFMY